MFLKWNIFYMKKECEKNRNGWTEIPNIIYISLCKVLL